jgi:hypothetical protein
MMSAPTLFGFHDEEHVAPERQRMMREELLRQQRLYAVRRSNWEELASSEVVFARRWVEHRPTRRRFKVSRGLLDAVYSPVTAYVITENGGDVIALEELR